MNDIDMFAKLLRKTAEFKEGEERKIFEDVANEIELRRAPGTCCPKSSCYHDFNGTLGELMPHQKAALECEGCGKACAHCDVRPKELMI